MPETCRAKGTSINYFCCFKLVLHIIYCMKSFVFLYKFCAYAVFIRGWICTVLTANTVHLQQVQYTHTVQVKYAAKHLQRVTCTVEQLFVILVKYCFITP
jgi:hypothetical protein